MEDLFNQFKDNLENRPEPAFDEKAWRRLERSLDRTGQPPARRATAAWWALAAALLLLLAANGWALYRLHRAESPPAANNLQVLRDTVVQRQIIYRTDTVFLTKTLRAEPQTKAAQPGVAQWPSIGKPLAPRPERPLTGGMEQSALLFHQFRLAQQKRGPAGGQTSSAPPPRLAELAPAPLPLSGVPQPAVQTDLAAAKKPFRLRRQLRPLRPSGFRVGATAQANRPWSGDLDAGTGYLVSVQGLVEFPFRLRLWASYGVGRLQFSTDRTGADLGVPAVQPPDDDFELEKVQVPQPYRQFSLGMQYQFARQGKTQPLVGLGLASVFRKPYELTYEFEDETDDVEWELELAVDEAATFTDNLLVQAGIERSLGERIYWQLLASYRFRLREDTNPLPRVLGLQTSVQYRF